MLIITTEGNSVYVYQDGILSRHNNTPGYHRSQAQAWSMADEPKPVVGEGMEFTGWPGDIRGDLLNTFNFSPWCARGHDVILTSPVTAIVHRVDPKPPKCHKFHESDT